MIKILSFVIGGWLLALAAGCSVPPHPAVYWPAPPETPRLQWINTIYSEDSFEKTGSQMFMENMLGKPDLSFFHKPFGIASDGEGLVYVGDTDLGNIRVYDFNNKTNHLYTEQSSFGLLLGLAIDSKKNLYAIDGALQKITVFSPERIPLFSFGSGKDFYKPAYLAINEQLGRIYVTDSVGHKVVVFNMSGEFQFSFGSWGPGKGQFYSPQGIAVDSKNQVYVSDTLNARVEIFDGDGKFLSEFGERGDQEWQFEGPTGIAVDSEGHLYVLDARKAALFVYQPDGSLLLAMGGRPSTSALGFSLPLGLSIDVNDRIFITDAMNRSLTIWQYLTPAYLRLNPLDRAAMAATERRVEQIKKKLAGEGVD